MNTTHVDTESDTPTARFLMRSQSGRLWQVGPRRSDGTPTTLVDAQRIADEMGFTLITADA